MLRSRCMTDDLPLASPGLVSYRYKTPSGWMMIGAKDNADALREAGRGGMRDAVTIDKLQVWDGKQYVPAG